MHAVYGPEFVSSYYTGESKTCGDDGSAVGGASRGDSNLYHPVAALRVLPSETHREYIPVGSLPTSLLVKVSDGSTRIPA